MKISIIMPTYQDAESIGQAIESVINQTYNDWELIIVNDGSTDHTSEVVSSYLSGRGDKIFYCEQENADQLNAIKNGLTYATGDYVYILHSDDLLAGKETLSQFAAYEKAHPGYDAYMGNQILIDGDGREIRYDTVMPYRQNRDRAALLYLWLGRNLYIDFAFFRKDVYCTKIKKSYLDSNMPYWLDFSQESKCLDVKNMDFPMFRYRVFEGNYINSELGKLNVINGELRTLTNLMKYFYIPAYRLQYLAYRTANKLRLGSYFVPLYQNREEKNKSQIVRFVIEKRFGLAYRENLFLNKLVSFYDKYETNQNWETVVLPQQLTIYLGCDMRAFHKALLSHKLDAFYLDFLNKIGEGVHLFYCHRQDKEKVNQICEFFCIRPFVKIEVLPE
ncbi:glycosyltransferase [Neobittarella massiliensis]|uniref:Glycosyltransferase n=1 Tax=Neobittarella massiliensis (ex Bilen et al. 2018) TaxID=2041842 RepID=A0A8J6IMH5_9FIRM|nr:glycosyltransferase [Neobittarella massiliensis]MBC3516419.1 glycosyltransferase [Neobittarella massiliensis]